MKRAPGRRRRLLGVLVLLLLPPPLLGGAGARGGVVMAGLGAAAGGAGGGGSGSSPGSLPYGVVPWWAEGRPPGRLRRRCGRSAWSGAGKRAGSGGTDRDRRGRAPLPPPPSRLPRPLPRRQPQGELPAARRGTHTPAPRSPAPDWSGGEGEEGSSRTQPPARLFPGSRPLFCVAVFLHRASSRTAWLCAPCGGSPGEQPTHSQSAPRGLRPPE